MENKFLTRPNDHETDDDLEMIFEWKRATE